MRELEWWESSWQDDEWGEDEAGDDFPITDAASLERLARCAAHPRLTGPDGDEMVAHLVRWAQINDWCTGEDRALAWQDILDSAFDFSSTYPNGVGPGITVIPRIGIDVVAGEEVHIRDQAGSDWRATVVSVGPEWLVVDILERSGEI